MKIHDTINSIEKAYQDVIKKAEERQLALVKPPHSLGRLEDISIKMAGITGKVKNKIDRRRIIIMCSDNGVVEEGVASAPQSVTLSQTINFTKAKTGVSCLAKHYGIDLCIVDVGINGDVPEQIVMSGDVLVRKLAYGTNNISKGAAMTREQAEKAIEIGIEMADIAKADGFDIVGVGEMGIGNTTTSSAVLSCILDIDAKTTVGRGGCITDEMLAHKIEVVKTALSVNKPDKNDIIDVISKVGGFDIAAMTGVYLGCAKNRIPVVIDGFISAVAALCAYKINPIVKDYMFASHKSEEAGYKIAVDEIGIVPMFDLAMRLGEGSGCIVAFSIIESALTVMNDMATFDEADIDDKYLDGLR